MAGLSLKAAALTALVAPAVTLDNGFTRPPLGWSALYGAPFSQVNETICRTAAQGLVDGLLCANALACINMAS